jgi:hypothetical protein
VVGSLTSRLLADSVRGVCGCVATTDLGTTLVKTQMSLLHLLNGLLDLGLVLDRALASELLVVWWVSTV